VYVYAYHAPKINAIKIGMGQDPWVRMDHYSYSHGFDVDSNSLHAWELPYDVDAKTIENYLHRNIGLPTKPFRRAKELFDLKDTSYQDALHKLKWLMTEEGINLTLAAERAARARHSILMNLLVVGTILLAVLLMTPIGRLLGRRVRSCFLRGARLVSHYCPNVVCTTGVTT
jgi:hypothetical protein